MTYLSEVFVDIDTALQGYADTRQRLRLAWSNPGQLGDVALKMATYGSYIGDSLGSLRAEYEQSRAQTYLKHLNAGKSASNAENLARSENFELKGQIARLELAHKNLWGLVSIIQSRLRGLESEAKNQQ
jgi:hypothetical protein